MNLKILYTLIMSVLKEKNILDPGMSKMHIIKLI
jgi:hypothetical protein